MDDDEDFEDDDGDVSGSGGETHVLKSAIHSNMSERHAHMRIRISWINYYPPQIIPSIQLVVLVTIPVLLKYKYETPKTPLIFLQFTI